jgi:cellulose synthase operon protein YhjQ
MPLICFASPVGGSGRTTLSANVARECARLGQRVIAVDLDSQNAMGTHFGLDLRDAFGFLATLRYAADPTTAWRAALRASPSGVSFLPFGQVGLEGAIGVTQSLIEQRDHLGAAVQDMLTHHGVVIVADLPAGPQPALAALLPYIDLLVLPLLPVAAHAAQLPAVLGGRFAGSLPESRIGFVVNQWDMPGKLSRVVGQGMLAHLDRRVIGVVRHDDTVPEAAAAQRLLADMAPHSPATEDIAQLAASILQVVAEIGHGTRPQPGAVLPAYAALPAFRSRSNAPTPTRPTVAQDTSR